MHSRTELKGCGSPPVAGGGRASGGLVLLGEMLIGDAIEAAPESQQKTREGEWDCFASRRPDAEGSGDPGRGFRHALLTRQEALWDLFLPRPWGKGGRDA